MSTVVAGIDCGTHSTRLLVGELDGRSLHTRERLMRITKLGRGTDASERLDPAAIERTVAALRDYRRVLDRFGAQRVRMTATSAARDAENRDELFDAAEAVIGVRPELLSGEDEARLSFLGATAELDPESGPFLVVDIGGGSTEFAYGGATFETGVSVDMGCLRFTEAYLQSDPPLPEELSAAISVATAHCEDVTRKLPGAARAPTFVGLAGTVSAVAAIEQGLADYDRDRIHHFHLTRDAAEDVFRTLATESLADRLHNPGLEPDRADVIVAGCCILVAVFRHFGFDECLVSEADILDGLALTAAG